MATNSIVLGIDVGEKRVGLAIAGTLARLAHPHSTVANDGTVYDTLAKLVRDEDIARVVVGLPRNIHGEDTHQTRYVRQFVEALKHHIRTVPIDFHDEGNTSQKAEAELRSRKQVYEKADIDALAATYILQDYLDQHQGGVL